MRVDCLQNFLTKYSRSANGVLCQIVIDNPVVWPDPDASHRIEYCGRCFTLAPRNVMWYCVAQNFCDERNQVNNGEGINVNYPFKYAGHHRSCKRTSTRLFPICLSPTFNLAPRHEIVGIVTWKSLTRLFWHRLCSAAYVCGSCVGVNASERSDKTTKSYSSWAIVDLRFIADAGFESNNDIAKIASTAPQNGMDVMQPQPLEPIPKMPLGRPNEIQDPAAYRGSSLIMTDLSGMQYMAHNSNLKMPKADLYLADNYSEDVIPLNPTETIQTKMEML